MDNNKKKIAIYGCGAEGEKIYYRYKEYFDFAFAIDRNVSYFHNLKVYRIEDKDIFPDVDYILISSLIYFDEISKSLTSYGFIYGIDYGSINDLLGYKKEKCIIYGNCHMVSIGDFLKSNRIFRERYDVSCFFVHENAEEHELYPNQKELTECALLIAQDIRDDNKVGAYSYSYLEKHVSDECVCIKVPNLYGMNIYFPQLTDLPFEESVNVTIKNIIFKRDYFIEQNLKEGKSIQEIAEIIKNGVVFSADIINSQYKKELMRYKKREENCSFSITDYIENNLYNKRLFYEIYHPTQDIFKEKAKRILDILEIKYDGDFGYGINVDHYDQNELFIYGCVKKFFNLDFKDGTIRNNHCDYTMINMPIDLDEYIYEYKCWFDEYNVKKHI